VAQVGPRAPESSAWTATRFPAWKFNARPEPAASLPALN